MSWHLVYLLFGKNQNIAQTDTSGYNKKNKCKTKCPSFTPAIRPVPHSPETIVPIFVQLSSLEDADYDELNDCNYADFEIDDGSSRNVFDQHKVNAMP